MVTKTDDLNSELFTQRQLPYYLHKMANSQKTFRMCLAQEQMEFQEPLTRAVSIIQFQTI